METISQYLQENIVLTLFFVIGLGYLIGKVKVASIELGSTTGILIVGLVIGLLKLDVPPIVKGVAFTLYLFVLGIQMGPGLVHMLTSRVAIKYLVLALSTGVFIAVSSYFVALLFGLDNIVTAGLISGASTTSAVLAGAQGAVSSGGVTLPEGLDTRSASDLLGGAYAITYLYGTFGLIILLKLCPALVGKDIAVEAAKLDKGKDAKLDVSSQGGAIRAFRVTEPKYVGKTIAQIEARAAEMPAAERGLPTLIEKVYRGGEPQELSSDFEIQEGDVIAVWAMPGILSRGTTVLGEEVTDPEVLGIKIDSHELVVTNGDLVGRSLADLVRQHGRGVTVDRIIRRGTELPLRGDLSLARGDVIFAGGPARQLDAFADVVGYVVRDQLGTNFINLGLFLAIFGMLGTITVTIAGVEMSLIGGTAIGAMIGGAVLGWLRSRSPLYGTVAAPVADGIGAVGLGLFIAAVAIGAGGSLVQVLREFGLSLVIAGVIVTTFSTFATFLFGHFILRLNVAENAGATCGAMTGVAINEVMKDAKSAAPAIGYALPGALNNVVFTVIALLLMSIL